MIYFILANFQLTGLKSNENDHSKTTIITIEPPELQNESQNQGKKYLLNLEQRPTDMWYLQSCAINESTRLALLIVNIYFIFYEFPDGIFKQSILAFFVLF